MSDLRDLLFAEAERQRPASTPPYDEIVRRSHRRSRLRVAAAGSAVVAVVALAAVSSAVLIGSDDDQTRNGPAGPPVSTTPSIPTISGPRTLGAPIEMREVIQAPETCQASEARVYPWAGSDGCWQLAEPEIVVRHVSDLSVIESAAADGSAQGDRAIMITLDAPDAAEFAALTADRWDGERVALVVNGVVYSAPQIQGQITGGTLQLHMDASTIERLLNLLTTDSS